MFPTPSDWLQRNAIELVRLISVLAPTERFPSVVHRIYELIPPSNYLVAAGLEVCRRLVELLDRLHQEDDRIAEPEVRFRCVLT